MQPDPTVKYSLGTYISTTNYCGLFNLCDRTDQTKGKTQTDIGTEMWTETYSESIQVKPWAYWTPGLWKAGSSDLYNMTHTG